MEKSAHFELILRLADDHLIAGHRLSEWCGHAPMLEEDLALPNIALDLIGQARALYAHAGDLEGKGRDEDALAYLRVEREYKNLLIVERPNGDFAHTILKHLFYAVFMEAFWDRALTSTDDTLKGIAGKAEKEVAYHVRHTGEWAIRLGDGTEESAGRMAAAIEALAPYTGEFFETDAVTDAAATAGIAPSPADLKAPWETRLRPILIEATLDLPEDPPSITGGRDGRHGEEMGFLLAELQVLPRTYPGATW